MESYFCIFFVHVDCITFAQLKIFKLKWSDLLYLYTNCLFVLLIWYSFNFLSFFTIVIDLYFCLMYTLKISVTCRNYTSYIGVSLVTHTKHHKVYKFWQQIHHSVENCKKINNSLYNLYHFWQFLFRLEFHNSWVPSPFFDAMYWKHESVIYILINYIIL